MVKKKIEIQGNGHYLQERNHPTTEMKKIIEKGSNLLNKIILNFFSHRAELAR